MTLAARIRAHAAQHPDLSPSERARVLALALGRQVTRQHVDSALRRPPTGRKPPGRPRVGAGRAVERLRAITERWLAAAAAVNPAEREAAEADLRQRVRGLG